MTASGGARWLSIGAVARELGVTRWTALARVRSGSIPGGERMYSHERGERWHVDAEMFWAWRKAQQERGVG